MDSALLYPNWREKVSYSHDGPRPHVLVDDDRMKVVVAGLEAGGKIPPHPEKAGVYHILEGKGWMIVNGERMLVEAGATVVVPDGGTRGFEAETRLAFLAVRVA